jgi:hypothetical protein
MTDIGLRGREGSQSGADVFLGDLLGAQQDNLAGDLAKFPEMSTEEKVRKALCACVSTSGHLHAPLPSTNRANPFPCKVVSANPPRGPVCGICGIVSVTRLLEVERNKRLRWVRSHSFR